MATVTTQPVGKTKPVKTKAQLAAEAKKKAAADKKAKDKAAKERQKRQKINQWQGQFSDARTLMDKLGLNKPLTRINTGPSADMASVIERLKGQQDRTSADFLGKRSAEMSSLLGTLQGGIGGLNAVENQGLRERAQRALDSNYQTSLQKIYSQARRAGGSGAANASMLASGRDRMQQQNQLEQDLMLKNIDVQDQRRRDYLSALSGAEGDEFTRGRAATQDYTLALGDRDTNALEREKVNLKQERADRSAKAGGLFGLVNMFTNKDLTDEQIALAKQGKSSADTTGNRAGLEDAMRNIFSQMYGEEASI